jgi:hypothetical protein
MGVCLNSQGRDFHSQKMIFHGENNKHQKEAYVTYFMKEMM